MTKKIIVAPLNWGLGHASRCVPIIRFLQENNFTPILASDGIALQFLQKEFPTLESLELPTYGISYSKNLQIVLWIQTPKILKAIKVEQKIIEAFIAKNNDVVGIISDNRFGVRSRLVHSVYITHQINVLSGFTWLTSKIHQQIIRKFDECWVPDTPKNLFAGKLSKANNLHLKVKYIGVLSRFFKKESPIKNDILIILSGIESQRSKLEKKMIEVFQNSTKKIVLIQGKIDEHQTKKKVGEIAVYNYLLSEELEREINQSALIICRSGYSSIMDLAVMQKKAFFIPTNQQTEQEYLAYLLEKQQQAPFCKEDEFTIKSLEKIENYSGLFYEKNQLDKELLRFF